MGFGKATTQSSGYYNPICEIDLSKTQLKTIPEYAFYDFHFIDFTSCVKSNYPVIKLPETLISIQAHSFENAKGNSYGSINIHITIPQNVTIIDQYAFSGVSVSLSFCDNAKLESIGDNAFLNANLFLENEELILPHSLKSIGNNAFYVKALGTLNIPSSVKSLGESVVNRAVTRLKVESGSYAALYASENGYPTVSAGEEDTSWLNN